MTTQISRMPKATTPTPAPAPAPGTPAEPAPPTTVNVSVQTGAPAAKEFDEFVVLLDDQATEKISKAFDMPTGLKRREFVAQTLIDNMMKTQQPLWDVLDGLEQAGHVAPGGYAPLWIQNAIVVKGDEEAMTVMANAAGVAQAVKSARYVLDKPPIEVEEFVQHGRKGKVDADADPQWNTKRVKAEAAWKDGLTGKGVTVVGIDTGVDPEHPALLTNFRGYDPRSGQIDITANWLDTTDASPDKMVDDDGHGTHTIGTIVGSDGRNNKIGIAPDATWFAARGLGPKGGTDGMLLRAFQYAVAPRVPNPGHAAKTKRDLSLGADVINNSWGSNDGLSTSYLSALRNMAAMGVINVFAAGNDGQGGKAGSVGSPASSPYVISVAATDRKDKVADFSSRGPNPLPSIDGEPSPFVGAPGVDVRSSIPGGGYERGWQGTSMAAPAIAGLVTLAQQAAKEETGHMFDVVTMKEVLKRAAQDVAPKGVDTGTGYGIPTAENLRAVVKQVAIDKGLKKPAAEPVAPKPATRRTRRAA